MTDTRHYVATTNRVWLPNLGTFAFFSDGATMRRGLPTRMFELRGPNPPVALPIDWTEAGALAFPRDGNTIVGDCMYAAACHGDNTFTGNNGNESSFNEADIIEDYLAISGGDNGLNVTQTLGLWAKGLVHNASATIHEALALDPRNASAMQAAVYFFGGVFFMLDLPDTWLTFGPGAVWDAPAVPNPKNAHAVWWNGVRSDGAYQVQTWGLSGWITPAGVAECNPSCFVVFSGRWFNANGVAPNGLSYNTLARLWAQFGGSPLPYQTRILETPTTFANESNGVWLLADYDRDGVPDLTYIKTNNTAKGYVEVHIASGRSNYGARILETPTTFQNENNGTWLIADYDHDRIPDLVYIKTNGTPNGHVEVHIASGVSKYQTRIFQRATAFQNEANGTWLLADYDRDGILDLVYIKTNNTGTGFVEVHVASGASQYQTFILHAITTFTSENNGTWLLWDFDHDGILDLVYIKTSSTAYGTVEVHVASGASNFSRRIWETGTTYDNENDGAWLLGDFSKKGSDLVFIKTNNTPNNHVEVHVASQ